MPCTPPLPPGTQRRWYNCRREIPAVVLRQEFIAPTFSGSFGWISLPFLPEAAARPEPSRRFLQTLSSLSHVVRSLVLTLSLSLFTAEISRFEQTRRQIASRRSSSVKISAEKTFCGRWRLPQSAGPDTAFRFALFSPPSRRRLGGTGNK